MSDHITPSTRGRRSGGRGIGGENLGTLAIARSRLRACDTWSTWPSYLPLPRLVFSDIMVPHQVGDVARAVFERIGKAALVQVFGGLSIVGIGASM